MTRRLERLIWIVLASYAALAAGESRTIVFCAPGHPSTTEQAAPTMESFAAAVAGSESWPAGPLLASYHPDESVGVERIAEDATILAVVTLPFYLAHRKDLNLQPALQAVPVGEPEQVWTLVAAKGRITKPADLSGWELVSTAAHATAFIRGPALGAWGALPEDVEIKFSSRLLSALRRAARGENVAVLLDPPQTAGLPDLPFHDDLETVTRSETLPVSVLCVVDGRIDDGIRSGVIDAFSGFHRTDAGREALEGIRVVRFRRLDNVAVRTAEISFDQAVETER